MVVLIALTLAGCSTPVPVGTDGEVEPRPDPTHSVTSPTTPSTPSDRSWVTLSLPPEDGAPILLEMSRSEVDELLGPIASELELLTMDPDTLLRSALDQIRSACGTDWARDTDNPAWDCSQTALGQTFGTGWAETAEFAMVRLLASTPANTDVRGTSLEGVAGAADFLQVGGGFSNILAETLERGRTDLAVGNEALVAAVREGLLATHPALTVDGGIPITLEDALTDLATLADKLGPSGDHPGVVDPGRTPYGQVLADDFTMGLTMDSHLEVYDGLDLSLGKGYLVASTGDLPVSLDFLDPERFTIEGLVDQPVVDLRLALQESPRTAEPCTPDNTCQGNLPGAPVNAESVWSLEPWTIEHVVADAARREHEARVYTARYTVFFVPVVTIRIGQGDTPPGWIDYDVLLDIGNPPTPQYLWELLLEVAQQNLHTWDTYQIDEGASNPAFSLTEVPTGLSAVEAEAAVRETLQEQAGTIAEALFGDYRKNSDPVDMIYARTPDGTPALQFVSAHDRSAQGTPSHEVVGFFADEALTQRVSVEIGGRHVWVPAAGTTTLYAQDDAGQRFELVVRAGGGEAETIDVAVTEVL